MIVLYLYGEDVYQNMSLQLCIEHFNQLDEAMSLIESRTNLKFDSIPTISLIGYRVYDLLNSSRKIRLIAESVPTLKQLKS